MTSEEHKKVGSDRFEFYSMDKMLKRCFFPHTDESHTGFKKNFLKGTVRDCIECALVVYFKSSKYIFKNYN